MHMFLDSILVFFSILDGILILRRKMLFLRRVQWFRRAVSWEGLVRRLCKVMMVGHNRSVDLSKM